MLAAIPSEHEVARVRADTRSAGLADQTANPRFRKPRHQCLRVLVAPARRNRGHPHPRGGKYEHELGIFPCAQRRLAHTPSSKKQTC